MNTVKLKVDWEVGKRGGGGGGGGGGSGGNSLTAPGNPIRSRQNSAAAWPFSVSTDVLGTELFYHRLRYLGNSI